MPCRPRRRTCFRAIADSPRQLSHRHPSLQRRHLRRRQTSFSHSSSMGESVSVPTPCFRRHDARPFTETDENMLAASHPLLLPPPPPPPPSPPPPPLDPYHAGTAAAYSIIHRPTFALNPRTFPTSSWIGSAAAARPSRQRPSSKPTRVHGASPCLGPCVVHAIRDLLSQPSARARARDFARNLPNPPPHHATTAPVFPHDTSRHSGTAGADGA